MIERLNKGIVNWIKCVIWIAVYTLFICWVGNFWWLLLLPIIFDMYITRLIPWDFWKKTKNRVLYAIFSWIDAILFALIAVYFINLYIFQNYQIPTSSLEKTLLVGDFLVVSKATYGPRIPNTPLSMPLVQHTFPWGGKSYIENPQWQYRRLKGIRNVRRGDIVVFNFPTGDTVPSNINNPDYYTLVFHEGVRRLSSIISVDSILKHKDKYRDEIVSIGRSVVCGDKKKYGEILWRPVDRRDNYVKRCVGIPGDKFQIIDNQIYINDSISPDYPGVQYNYYIQTDGTQQLTSAFFDKLDISKADRNYYLFLPENDNRFSQFDTSQPIWDIPLTAENYKLVSKMPYIKQIVRKPTFPYDQVFPLYGDYGWNRDNFGPVKIPKKGATVSLTTKNLPIYEHIIRNYERNTLLVKGNKIFINGNLESQYTFKMDYYFMMGDNRHNSADSRYWGFVPEDHIVGQPLFVWLSLDKDKGWFGGKIRFNRFFKNGSR